MDSYPVSMVHAQARWTVILSSVLQHVIYASAPGTVDYRPDMNRFPPHGTVYSDLYDLYDTD